MEAPARRLTSLVALLPVSLATAPPTAPPTPQGEPAAAPPAHHLAELLPRARVESPLTGLAAAPDLSALEDPARDLLLEEGFEDFDWEFAGWPRLEQAAVVAEGEGHVLRLDAPTGRASLGWSLPVRPDAFYRFERAVRVEGEAFCDLYVVESRAEPGDVFGGTSFDATALFLAGRGVALKVHSLPLDEGRDGEWQRASTSFTPTPRTRSLVVLVRERVGADPGALVHATSFDDVVLEEVVPDRAERTRLLKGAHAAPGADPALGMEKVGLLLPLPSPEGGRAGEPPESNYTWRHALYAPPTTTLAFDVELPAGARLCLATGLARETPPGAVARFRVELSAAGLAEPRVLLERSRTARLPEWGWQEEELDLSAWGGSAVTLTLVTEAERGEPHPLWADPRVEAAAGADDPLVILIAVDTLRADRLSAYGYERDTSPALDRLAADGVRFDQARSNCNWTCPSFASIFTGLVPSRHGVTSYGPATPLPDELVTLAEHFHERGYETRSIAYKVPLFDGNYEQGFDEAFNVPRDVIRGEENLARALEWLGERRGGPAFLFLHFNDPHQPFVHPEPLGRTFGGAADGELAELPEGPGGDGQDRFSLLYDGAVAYVDSCIGRFLDELRARGLYDGAVIAFVADHGEALWEHGRAGHGGAELYDEVAHVPLIVKPPAGTCEAGRVVACDVSGFDVMPTLLELAGIAPPAGLDARSLVPLIRGDAERLDRPVVTETSLRGLAVTDAGWKLVVQPGGGREALYDLTADPGETRDVRDERPGEEARLRALAVAYVLEHRPGSYLLVHAGAEPGRCAGPEAAVRTVIGPRPAVEAGRAAWELSPGEWALLEVEGAEAGSVALEGIGTRGPQAGFEPWVAGRLAALGGAGVWRVRGPEPLASSAREAEAPVDVEMLEALKRLGYAE